MPIRPSMSGSTRSRKTPELVRGFVRGMMKSLKFVDANHDEAAESPRSSFRPCRSTISRRPSTARSPTTCGARTAPSAAPHGTPPRPWSWAPACSRPTSYDEIIDMSFVDSLKATL